MRNDNTVIVLVTRFAYFGKQEFGDKVLVRVIWVIRGNAVCLAEAIGDKDGVKGRHQTWKPRRKVTAGRLMPGV